MSELLIGSVTISKRLMKHPLYAREPLCAVAAWLDLLMLANDQPRTAWVNGERVDLKRGQLCWAIYSLAERWRRSREWVTKFLHWCQDEERMLILEISKRRTVITIVNYDAYNTTEPAADQTTEPTTEPAAQPAQKVEGGMEKEGGMYRNGAIEIPEDTEVLHFADEWPGEPANGAPPLAKEFVVEWLAKMNGRTLGWPANWKRALVAQWRAAFREWGQKKNGSVWEVKQKIAALQQREKEHPANEESATWSGDPTDEEIADLEKIRGELSAASLHLIHV